MFEWHKCVLREGVWEGGGVNGPGGIGWSDRSAEALFGVGTVSQYVGAAIAVRLFDDIAPAGVAFVRVLTAGLLIVGARRVWRRAWTASDLQWALLFGVVLAGMNLSIYLAIEELPLGNAVAIEFSGPIAVAALGVRSRRALAALVIATVGVVLLAGVESSATARGVLFALLAGALWAGYIMLGHRVAREGAAVDGLGIGMMAGGALLAVVGARELAPAFDEPWLLVVAATTGLLSNVIPYGIDQLVLQRLARDRFALLQSLLPVTAALIGLVILDQRPSAVEMAGILLVMLALAIGSDTRLARSVDRRADGDA